MALGFVMFWFLVFAKTLFAFSKAGGDKEQRYPSSLHHESCCSEGPWDSTPALVGLTHQQLPTAGRLGKEPVTADKCHLNKVRKQ